MLSYAIECWDWQRQVAQGQMDGLAASKQQLEERLEQQILATRRTVQDHAAQAALVTPCPSRPFPAAARTLTKQHACRMSSMIQGAAWYQIVHGYVLDGSCASAHGFLPSKID